MIGFRLLWFVFIKSWLNAREMKTLGLTLLAVRLRAGGWRKAFSELNGRLPSQGRAAEVAAI
jgi:hypothetical protein